MRHAAFSPRLESCLWTCGLFREFNKDLCPGELYSLWWEIKWIIDKWKSFSQQVQLKLLDVTDRISCASRMWIPRQAPGRGSCEPGVKQGKRKKKKTGRRYPSCESEFPGADICIFLLFTHYDTGWHFSETFLSKNVMETSPSGQSCQLALVRRCLEKSLANWGRQALGQQISQPMRSPSCFESESSAWQRSGWISGKFSVKAAMLEWWSAALGLGDQDCC